MVRMTDAKRPIETNWERDGAELLRRRRDPRRQGETVKMEVQCGMVRQCERPKARAGRNPLRHRVPGPIGKPRHGDLARRPADRVERQ
jgi:hypothetical protein